MKNKKFWIAGAIAIVAAIIAAVCMLGKSSKETASVPVITLEGECLKDYQNWNDKSTYYPAKLTYTDGDASFTMDIEIKPQGTSSLGAPKKNFTVKFAEGVQFKEKWDSQKKYVLKADYIDPTCSGNVVSAQLAAQMNEKYGVLENTPNYGVIDGFPTIVKINGEDAGIFNLTIPKDAWLFNMDENNPNHLVLACEGWSEASRMQTAVIDYEADWSFEVGEATDENKAAFERLVTFVSTADDETFVRDFDQYLDLDACLNYICYINAAYAKDNVAKNMLMVTYDGKVWYPTLYDLDSLWGIDAMGTGLMEADGAWLNEMLSNGNCLLYRVNYYFGDLVRERYQQLRESILSKEHILESFEAYVAQIPQAYYDINNALWYADGTHIRTIDLMGQLMDEYLPIMDQNVMTATGASPAETAPTEVEVPATGNQNLVVNAPMIHYVWETNGVQHSLENLETLPVTTNVSYKLDGKAASSEEVAGKSGELELTLRVERKANAEAVYGVAAVMRLEAAQCKNLTITGGTNNANAEMNVCTGSAWLTDTSSTYEMKLQMDVSDFDPAAYVITVNPTAIGGGDRSLEALLGTASELTTIVDEGVALHTSLTEWHTYLTTMQQSLEGTASLAESMVSGENSLQVGTSAVMQNLLTKAEAEADELLNGYGYTVGANTTSEELTQMLSQVAADSGRTDAEKEEAAKLQELITNYVVVVNQLKVVEQAAAEVSNALSGMATTMPDLVGAYAYANDTLYAILYRVSTLYQNIANYYASIDGGTGWTGYGALQDVIIFTNHENIIP